MLTLLTIIGGLVYQADAADLSSRDYATREAATRRLSARGLLAVPTLLAEARTEESVARAGAVLARLRPPSLVGLLLAAEEEPDVATLLKYRELLVAEAVRRGGGVWVRMNAPGERQAQYRDDHAGDFFFVTAEATRTYFSREPWLYDGTPEGEVRMLYRALRGYK